MLQRFRRLGPGRAPGTRRLELLGEVYDLRASGHGQADTTFDFSGCLKRKGPLVLLFMAGSRN
jgi:hypothetical protein